ncbi:MAG: hypothetical protein VCD50_17505 [Alphaproteobacteria bacterium]
MLRPGGTLAANDWLRERPLPLSDELVSFVERAGLTYHWVEPDDYRDALAGAGFVDVALRGRAAWYVDQLSEEIKQLESGPMRARMIQAFDEESTEGWLRSWRLMETFARQGEICPTHIRAAKAA